MRTIGGCFCERGISLGTWSTFSVKKRLLWTQDASLLVSSCQGLCVPTWSSWRPQWRVGSRNHSQTTTVRGSLENRNMFFFQHTHVFYLLISSLCRDFADVRGSKPITITLTENQGGNTVIDWQPPPDFPDCIVGYGVTWTNGYGKEDHVIISKASSIEVGGHVTSARVTPVLRMNYANSESGIALTYSDESGRVFSHRTFQTVLSYLKLWNNLNILLHDIAKLFYSVLLITPLIMYSVLPFITFLSPLFPWQPKFLFLK